MDTEVGQIRVLPQQNSEPQETAKVELYSARAAVCSDDGIFSPGPCLHNKKFACVFIPCSLPLFYIAGELLFGVSVLCIMSIYLVGNTAKNKRSTVVTLILAVVAVQLMSIYCLLPYMWKSVFNIGLVLIYNVFIVLSGGVGLLQFKQLQCEEPQFVVYMEYILFVAYPIAGQIVMTSVSALVIGWWSAPFFCILYGFLFIQVFYPPSRPSFVYHHSVHRPGEQAIPDRFIIGPMEKTLLLFNLITVPGSMFIVIYILEFLHLVTWIKLLFCGLFPVFLCTCLDSQEVMDFLDFPSSTVLKARWSSGLSSLFIFTLLMWTSGTVSAKAVPILVGSVLIGLAMGITAKTPSLKIYHPLPCTVLALLYIFGIWSVLWNLGLRFLLSSVPLMILMTSLSALSILSVAAVLLSHSTRKEGFGVVLVVQSVGFVVCEQLMMEYKLYPVHYALVSGLIMLYVIYRLHTVRSIDWRVSWLCTGLHGCKLALYVSSLLPQHTLDESFLLPAVVTTSPALLAFLFILVITKILVFTDRKSVTVWEGTKLCAVVGVTVLAIYDSLILPVWLLTTHRWPSLADAIAAIIFIWGVLCLKVSLVQLSHNMDAKRMNIVLLCGAVLVEIIQPEFNPIKFGWGIGVYLVSLVLPLYSSTKILLAEDLSLPWLVLLSALTTLAMLVKLVKLEQASMLGRVLLSLLTGFPVGLKAASLLLPVLYRPPLLCFTYAVSSSLVVFLIISSWMHQMTASRASRGYSYLALVLSFFFSLFLESFMDTEQQPIHKADNRHWTSVSTCIPYHLSLHLLIALALKTESASTEESLEDKKGKLPLPSTALSSSVLANVSVVLSCALGLLCTPHDYWELWVSLCTSILMLLRPEGMASTDGRLVKLSPGLPTAILLPISMYIGTVKMALPVQFGVLSVIGYLLELFFLHCSLPTHYSLLHALWKGEISPSVQQASVFSAPANVVLVVYGSTMAGRIMGLLGLSSTYWVFYHVDCPNFENKG